MIPISETRSTPHLVLEKVHTWLWAIQRTLHHSETAVTIDPYTKFVKGTPYHTWTDADKPMRQQWYRKTTADRLNYLIGRLTAELQSYMSSGVKILLHTDKSKTRPAENSREVIEYLDYIGKHQLARDAPQDEFEDLKILLDHTSVPLRARNDSLKRPVRSVEGTAYDPTAQPAPIILDNQERPDNDMNEIKRQLIPPKLMADIKNRRDDHFFIAHDCSSPTGVHATSSIIDEACNPRSIKTVTPRKEQEYHIYQQVDTREVKGYSCEKWVTRSVVYCGNYDHVTTMLGENYYKKPVTMTEDQCRQLITGKYYDMRGVDHTVAPNQKFQISYFRHGRTYFSKGEGKCSGEKMFIHNELVSDMVEHISEFVLFREERIIERRDSSIIAFFQNVKLPCFLEDLGCYAGETYFAWNLSKKTYCPYREVKRFQGFIADSPAVNEQVLISTDGSNIRFTITGQTQICDREVHATTYPELVIYSPTYPTGNTKNHNDLQKIKPNEVKIRLYVNNRDDALYNHLKDELRYEFTETWRASCRERLEQFKLKHAVIRELPAIHTVMSLGNNFLVTAGEATYQYECRPVLVKALRAPKCYDALPVTREFQKPDTDSYLEQSRGIFLEPITHRLTNIAAQQPCAAAFAPLYKDVLNQWFQVKPDHFQNIPEPAILKMPTPYQRNYTEEADFSRGGVYNQEEIDAMVQSLEFSRIRDAVTTKIAYQTHTDFSMKYVSPNDMFPNVALPGGSWQTFILGRLWGFLRSFGEVASAAIATIILSRLIFGFCKIMYHAWIIFNIHGCSKKILWSVFPDTWLTRLRFKDIMRNRRFDDNDDDGQPMNNAYPRLVERDLQMDHDRAPSQGSQSTTSTLPQYSQHIGNSAAAQKAAAAAAAAAPVSPPIPIPPPMPTLTPVVPAPRTVQSDTIRNDTSVRDEIHRQIKALRLNTSSDDSSYRSEEPVDDDTTPIQEREYIGANLRPILKQRAPTPNASKYNY